MGAPRTGFDSAIPTYIGAVCHLGPYSEPVHSNLRHTYVVTCDKKAACPDLFATLPIVFHRKFLPFLLNIADVILKWK
jgi:hypothetical protein